MNIFEGIPLPIIGSSISINLLNCVITLVASILVYRYYSEFKRHAWYVPLTVVLGFFFSFYIIFWLSVDVASTSYDMCKMANYCDARASSFSLAPTRCVPPLMYVPNDRPISDAQLASELDCDKSVNRDGVSTNRLGGSQGTPRYTGVVGWVWRVLYWVTYVLCWTAYPLLMSYVRSAGFSVLERMRAAVVSNLIFYGVAGLLVLLGGVYLLVVRSLTPSGLLGVLIAGSNMYGLLLVTLFMGYGLVEVPRRLWRGANMAVELRRCQYATAALSEDFHVAQADFAEVLREVKALREASPPGDPFHAEVAELARKCPPEELERAARTRAPGTVEPTHKTLVALLARVKDGEHRLRVSRLLLQRNVEMAFFLEDVLNAENGELEWDSYIDAGDDDDAGGGSGGGPPDPVPSIIPVAPRDLLLPRGRARGLGFGDRLLLLTHALVARHGGRVGRRAEWAFYRHVRPWLRRLTALFFALMSLTLVWSEGLMLLYLIPLSFSPWAYLIDAFGMYDPGAVLFVLVPLGYMVVCVYWGLFSLKIFNYYRLLPSASDAASLLFAALYTCRLNAPLAYNFLGLIGRTGKRGDTRECTTTYPCAAFADFMGDMTVIPLVGGQLNYVLPLVLVAVVAVTLLNLYSRILDLLNLQRFKFDDTWEHSSIDEGKSILQRERQRRKRGGRHAVDAEFTAMEGVRASSSSSTSSLAGGMPRVKSLDDFLRNGSGDAAAPAQGVGGRAVAMLTSWWPGKAAAASQSPPPRREERLDIEMDDVSTVRARDVAFDTGDGDPEPRFSDLNFGRRQ